MGGRHRSTSKNHADAAASNGSGVNDAAIRCNKLSAVDTNSIKPRLGNPRKHSARQINQIAQSLLRHGFVAPILAEASGVIVAGEGRWRAAKQIGLERVPVAFVEGLTEDQIRSYVIADNQLTIAGEWNLEILSGELKTFEDLGIDLNVLGFDTAKIDLVLNRTSRAARIDEDAEIAAVATDTQPVTRVGDLWRLGRHLVFCGDACDKRSYVTLMARRKAQMVFSDLPYNVEIKGNVSGLGRVKHSEFVMASGEMTPQEFGLFLTRALTLMAQYSADGSIHYLCMDWRHMYDLLSAALPIYSEFKNLCVWNKTNAGMGAFYRSKHELIFAFKNGKAPHINNFGLGQWGRHRSNVWDYAGANTLTRERLEELALHPTVKPVAMIADAIKDCSKRGGLILDPFCGSGSTLLAAEITGRSCAAMELDPKYVDVTIRRWQKATGEPAIHVESGDTFEQREAARV